MGNSTCSENGCTETCHARGRCHRHYRRWLRDNPTNRVQVKLSWPENLLGRLDFQPDGCVVFTGYRDKQGYGTVRHDGRTRRAHRVMWEFMVGPIPDGLVLDHLCRNRACVNPGHLEPVTNRENLRRGYWANITHCPQGHPYDVNNTIVYAQVRRRCRKCKAASDRRRYLRKRVWAAADATIGSAPRPAHACSSPIGPA